MKIEDVMSRPVITCRPTDTLNAAAGLMWENDCGALPVVDDQGLLVGIITDRDICMSTYTSGESIRSILVKEAMAKRVFSCLPSDTVAAAQKTLAQAQVRRLPVIDGHGKPIGLVSINDLARTTENNRAALETLNTIAAVCEPRHRAIGLPHAS